MTKASSSSNSLKFRGRKTRNLIFSKERENLPLLERLTPSSVLWFLNVPTDPGVDKPGKLKPAGFGGSGGMPGIPWPAPNELVNANN